MPLRAIRQVLLLLFLSQVLGAQTPYLISTFAGVQTPPTAMPAVNAAIGVPSAVAVDAAGNLYIASQYPSAIFKLDTAGVLTRVAGNGLNDYSGDFGPAISAALYGPTGVAVDAAGNVYIGQLRTVRKVTTDGIIRPVAGVSACCQPLGDGGPATAAGFGQIGGIAVDSAGNLLIADFVSNRIRKVDTNGVVTTVAGNGAAAYSGDGKAAVSASLNNPKSVGVDSAGNVYIADSYNQAVRKVTNGIITTISPSIPTSIDAVSVKKDGTVLFSFGTGAVGAIAPGGGWSIVAGTGATGYGGDGGPATNAILFDPTGIAADSSGNVYIADLFNSRIRKVSNGIINTIAGGAPTISQNSASLSSFLAPQGLTTDSAGNLYVADTYANRIYKISPAGAISSFAGNGGGGTSGDNGPATAAQLFEPSALALDPLGNMYVVHGQGRGVRKISAAGQITTVAGLGTTHPVTSAQAVAVDSSGNLFIADGGRIQKLTPGGAYTTIAGNGSAGYSGDGGPATAAQFNYPSGVAVDSLGNLYIADTYNYRIRKVDKNGNVTTVAGTGVRGTTGDGGPATLAALSDPSDLAFDASGNLFFTSGGSIRMISTAGVISTIAGQFGVPYPGDGTAALSAPLSGIFHIAVDGAGKIYVSDPYFSVVRLLTLEGGPPVLTVASSHQGDFLLGSTDKYTLTVSNAALAGSTSGQVTVTDFVPAAFTLSSISGVGWNCNSNSCDRSDVLPAGASYQPIEVDVTIPATSPPQVTNQATVTVGGLTKGTSQMTLVSNGTLVTLQTSPPGLQVSFDGASLGAAPQAVRALPGAHTIGVLSTQAGNGGSQYVFSVWNDSGTITHSINVTNAPVTYTATFKTQYQLTITSLPGPAGILTPASGAFYDSGSVATVRVIASNAPYAFTGWSGAASGTANSVSVTMSGPQSVVANFSVPGFTCAVTNDATASAADVQWMIYEALGIAQPNHDLNRDLAVNIADVQKVIEAAAGVGCLY